MMDRVFGEVQSPGLSSSPPQCGAIGTTSQAHIDAVFLDGDQRALKEGEQAGIVSVAFVDDDGQPEETMSPDTFVEEYPDIADELDIEDHYFEVDPGADDISMDYARIYALPDVDCAGDDGQCPEGFRCEPSRDGMDRCHYIATTHTPTEPEFSATEPSSQALGVAIADVGKWNGAYHQDFNGLYEFSSSTDNRRITPSDDVAVDPGGLRAVALLDMADRWEQLVETVGDDDRSAHFGFWRFRESNELVKSLLPTGQWTTDPDTAFQAVEDSDIGRRTAQGRAGIYNSLIAIIDQGFAGADASDFDDRHLVVLAAGYDEQRQNTVSDAIQAADEADVRVSIVQVDSPPNKPHQLPDDRHYYQDQDPCTSSDECADYETCRQPTRYTDDLLTNDPADIVWPAQGELDHHYCLPDYDENGRVGPLEEFRRLTCETGGYYTYLPKADYALIAEALSGTMWASEAAWTIEFAIDEPPPQTGEAYLVGTEMKVHLEGHTRELRMELDDGTGGSPDGRRAFFTPASD